MNCRIEDIAYYLPERIVTNKDLVEENREWDLSGALKKTGVESRHIAKEEETALDLAYEACKILFSKEATKKEEIDALIFCTQSADYILPSNAYLLHEKLGLDDNVFAFDINLACSGFVYGLSIAKSFINTYNLSRILLVTSDTYSKYIHPKDKSVRMLFGDGAAASLISRSEKGIIDIKLGAFGKGYNKFIIPAGGCRMPRDEETSKEMEDNSGNIRTQENISMQGFGLLSLVMTKATEGIKSILLANNLRPEDVDLFVFHQASKAVLDALAKSLEVPQDRVFSNIMHVGNTVSASIPIAIKDALSKDLIKPKDKILLSGFGVGFSWGSAIIEWQ